MDGDVDRAGDACEPFVGDGTTDSDGDGVPDLNEAGYPHCRTPVNTDLLDDSLRNDGCPSFGPAEALCTDSVDDDADGWVNDGCPQVGVVSEGAYNAGTDHLARCEVGQTAIPSSGWPLDLVSAGIPNSTDKANILDLTSFLAPVRRLDARPPQGNFDQRWDLSPGPAIGNNWVQINDLTSLVAGTSGFPPMNGGLKVFGQPFTCTAHPVYGD
jgi:hypothetical protein